MQLKEGEERIRLEDLSCGLFTQYVTILGVSAEATAPVVALDIDSNLGKVPKIENNVPKTAKFNPITLGDISKLLRSKNAGPYEITLDVMFDSEEKYQLVKSSNMLTTASMATLFAVSEEDIVWDGFFDQALAYKVTIPRLRNGKPATSGGYMENDVHGSQMYIGLMNMKLPETLTQKWGHLQKE
jgi:hypothetical protein